MSRKSLSPADKKQEAIIARESVAAVYELGRSLPKEIVGEIYAQVVTDLAIKAGLAPRRPKGGASRASEEQEK